jgi:hypothetical protein
MFGLGIIELVLGGAILLAMGSAAIRLLAIMSGAPDRRLPDSRARELEERTARLEEHLVTLTEQVERVVTEQEFTNKLLRDRAGMGKEPG